MDDCVRIAEIMLGDMKKTLAEKGISLVWTDEAAKYVAEKSFSTKFGARNMRRFISRNIEDAVAEKIIAAGQRGVKMISVDAKDDEIVIEAV